MAYGKIKTGKGDGRIKVDPREKGGFNPEPEPGGGKGGGRMYTGGTPNFDESTGKYREGYKPGSATPKPRTRVARPIIGVKPGLPIVKPGRPVPGDLIRRKKPTPLGRKPGRKTIMPVPKPADRGNRGARKKPLPPLGRIISNPRRPKPKPKPFDLRKEKQLPRKPLSVKKTLLISRKKIGGR